MKHAQTILITGATSGIGRHASLALASAASGVIATGRNTAALAALGADGVGLQLDVVSLDVTDHALLVQAVAEVARLTSGRGVDVLVNNVGYGGIARMREVCKADVRAM